MRLKFAQKTPTPPKPIQTAERPKYTHTVTLIKST